MTRDKEPSSFMHYGQTPEEWLKQAKRDRLKADARAEGIRLLISVFITVGIFAVVFMILAFWNANLERENVRKIREQPSEMFVFPTPTKGGP